MSKCRDAALPEILKNILCAARQKILLKSAKDGVKFFLLQHKISGLHKRTILPLQLTDNEAADESTFRRPRKYVSFAAKVRFVARESTFYSRRNLFSF